MRREKFGSVFFILVALGMLSAPVRAEEPEAEKPEPKRAVTIDATFKASPAADNHDQVAVSVTKQAVRKDDKGGVLGAASLATFVTAIKPEALEKDKSIMMPAAKAGLEVYSGSSNDTAKEPTKDEKSVVVLTRATATRDTAVGERWSAIGALGVQGGMASRASSPKGTIARLPIQPGFTGSLSAVIEGGAGKFEFENGKLVGILGVRVEILAQYCASLSGEAALDLICGSVTGARRVGTLYGGAFEASLMYAHRIEDGAQKGYFFIAPAVSGAALTSGTGSGPEISGIQAGGRMGVVF